MDKTLDMNDAATAQQTAVFPDNAYKNTSPQGDRKAKKYF